MKKAAFSLIVLAAIISMNAVNSVAQKTTNDPGVFVDDPVIKSTLKLLPEQFAFQDILIAKDQNGVTIRVNLIKVVYPSKLLNKDWKKIFDDRAALTIQGKPFIYVNAEVAPFKDVRADEASISSYMLASVLAHENYHLTHKHKGLALEEIEALKFERSVFQDFERDPKIVAVFVAAGISIKSHIEKIDKEIRFFEQQAAVANND